MTLPLGTSFILVLSLFLAGSTYADSTENPFTLTYEINSTTFGISDTIETTLTFINESEEDLYFIYSSGGHSLNLHLKNSDGQTVLSTVDGSGDSNTAAESPVKVESGDDRIITKSLAFWGLPPGDYQLRLSGFTGIEGADGYVYDDDNVYTIDITIEEEAAQIESLVDEVEYDGKVTVPLTLRYTFDDDEEVPETFCWEKDVKLRLYEAESDEGVLSTYQDLGCVEVNEELSTETTQVLEMNIDLSLQDYYRFLEVGKSYYIRLFGMDSEPFELPYAFPDIEEHWGLEYIDSLYRESIISGYEDGTFRPDQSITRAEFTKLVLEGLNIDISDKEDYEEYGYVGDIFEDVSAEDWYYFYVEEAARIGSVEGYEDGTFKPNEPITRSEAIKILISTMVNYVNNFSLADTTDEETSVFTDVTESWQVPYIKTAYEWDLIGGYVDEYGESTGLFGPYNELTRAETSKIITLAKEIYEEYRFYFY